MLDHESAYSSIRGITALVMTWNAGATTPGDLRENTTDRGFFQSLITKTQQPDLLMFGFQELIDLEDKKMTASESTIRMIRILWIIDLYRNTFQREQEERHK